MVKVTKQIKIEISDQDFETLVDLCETNRLFFANHLDAYLHQFSDKRISDIQELRRKIFAAGED